jgi:hypothetical protein
VNRQVLPPPAICVLDSDQTVRSQLRALLPKAVAPLVDLWSEAIPPPAIRLFSTPAEATGAFGRISGLRSVMEPCLLITDQVGTVPHHKSVATLVRKKHPSMKILLYSGGIEHDDLCDLQYTHNAIDDYVPKGQHDRLKQRVAHWYRSYWDHSWLYTMRQHIAISEHPTEKFFPGSKGKWLSMVDIYWEIVHATEFGDELRAAWDRLRAANTDFSPNGGSGDASRRGSPKRP